MPVLKNSVRSPAIGHVVNFVALTRLHMRFLCFTALLYSVLLCTGCADTSSDAAFARVVNIADGDTFTMLEPGNTQVKVRLFGIDSPERAQPFGTAARRHLGQLLEGHGVRIDVRDRDRYGRSVAIAFRDDGLNINEAMLRDGFAWHYKQYDKNAAWSRLEADARTYRVGLWADEHPTPPWLWRKQKRKKAEAN